MTTVHLVSRVGAWDASYVVYVKLTEETVKTLLSYLGKAQKLDVEDLCAVEMFSGIAIWGKNGELFDRIDEYEWNPITKAPTLEDSREVVAQTIKFDEESLWFVASHKHDNNEAETVAIHIESLRDVLAGKNPFAKLIESEEP